MGLALGDIQNMDIEDAISYLREFEKNKKLMKDDEEFQNAYNELKSKLAFQFYKYDLDEIVSAIQLELDLEGQYTFDEIKSLTKMTNKDLNFIRKFGDWGEDKQLNKKDLKRFIDEIYKLNSNKTIQYGLTILKSNMAKIKSDSDLEMEYMLLLSSINEKQKEFYLEKNKSFFERISSPDIDTSSINAEVVNVSDIISNPDKNFLADITFERPDTTSNEGLEIIDYTQLTSPLTSRSRPSPRAIVMFPDDYNSPRGLATFLASPREIREPLRFLTEEEEQELEQAEMNEGLEIINENQITTPFRSSSPSDTMEAFSNNSLSRLASFSLTEPVEVLNEFKNEIELQKKAIDEIGALIKSRKPREEYLLQKMEELKQKESNASNLLKKFIRASKSRKDYEKLLESSYDPSNPEYYIQHNYLLKSYPPKTI